MSMNTVTKANRRKNRKAKKRQPQVPVPYDCGHVHGHTDHVCHTMKGEVNTDLMRLMNITEQTLMMFCRTFVEHTLAQIENGQTWPEIPDPYQMYALDSITLGVPGFTITGMPGDFRQYPAARTAIASVYNPVHNITVYVFSKTPLSRSMAA